MMSWRRRRGTGESGGNGFAAPQGVPLASRGLGELGGRVPDHALVAVRVAKDPDGWLAPGGNKWKEDQFDFAIRDERRHQASGRYFPLPPFLLSPG